MSLRRLLRANPRCNFVVLTLLVATTCFTSQSAKAIIFGSDGSEPVIQADWPDGAAEIFNHRTRIAWWEGPPFGGGQWHAECRGNADAFNKILAKFAQLDVKNKRLVVHDGIGRSFQLNPNDVPARRKLARIDWSFEFWQPARWQKLSSLPADLNPTELVDAALGPPAQIDLYTGGRVSWDKVVVPDGLRVLDQRLASQGFKLEDGFVLTGQVVDTETRQPIRSEMQLQSITAKPGSGYKYDNVLHATCDTSGRWQMKNVPMGRFRIVASAPDYVPRVVGYATVTDQPGWHEVNKSLSRPARVSGTVFDADGKPLAGVDVRLANVNSSLDGRYESPDEFTANTDDNGRFLIMQVPLASASVRIYKSGYHDPGLGTKIITPVRDLSLSMAAAGEIHVVVDFGKRKRYGEYLVEVEPAGGPVVGSWGGSAQLQPDNQRVFRDVPPGKYVVSGHPNPTTDKERTESVAVEIAGGESKVVTLRAK
jgi:hypothetical protein